jgi:hypothetical protein
VVAVILGVDACPTAVDEGRLTRGLAVASGADLARQTGHSRAGAVEARAAVDQVGLRVDAESAAIDVTGLAGKLTDSARAYSARVADGATIGLAVRPSSAMVAVDAGIDARAGAVHQARLARDQTNAAAADLPRVAGRSRSRAAAVAGRPAMSTVAARIDAGTAAVDEPSLARELASAAAADLAHGATRAPLTGAVHAAVVAVAHRVDADASAIDQPGLA